MYDGRKPEPPYDLPHEEQLAQAVELLRKLATEYRRVRFAFDAEDSRRKRCEELSDEVVEFLESIGG